MAISGVEQPEIIQVTAELRLRKYDGVYDFAFDWYQDEETVYLVDGVKKPYSEEILKFMYEYLNKQGELYFIEVLEGDAYKPIGDVCFWKDDMPIVIGDKAYRGKGIAKKVIATLMKRGQELGYDTLHVSEIYEYNITSRKCFEGMGFEAYEKTEKGNRFMLKMVSIRKFTLDDVKTMFEYSSSLENTYYMYNPPFLTLDETKQFMIKCIDEYESKNPKYLSYAVEYGGIHVGEVFASISGKLANIGWIIHKNYWGKGIATRGAELLIEKLKKAI